MLGTVTTTEQQTLSTLKAIKEAGFDGIELNGFMIKPTPLAVQLLTKVAGMPTGKGGAYNWKQLLTEAGLLVTGIHEDLGTITKNPDAIIAEAKHFGTDDVIITGMYHFNYMDINALDGLCKSMNSVGEMLADAGIHLLYHNHNCEFRRLPDGQTSYDFILKNTNPAFVNFEFDSYWPTEAGVSAIDLMRKLGNRMKLYHINDRGTKKTGLTMTPILKSDSMELGTGNMNLEELIQQALSVDVSAIVLESHKNWIDKSPIRSIQVSGEYLNKFDIQTFEKRRSQVFQ